MCEEQTAVRVAIFSYVASVANKHSLDGHVTLNKFDKPTFMEREISLDVGLSLFLSLSLS